MDAQTTTLTAVPSIDVKSMELPVTVRNSAILQEGVELFLQHGCLVIENAFDPEFIRKLHDEFTNSFKDYFADKIYDDALDVGDKRTLVTIKLEGSFNSSDYYAPAKVFPLLEFLLSKNLILAALGCVISLPGSKDQHRHRDYGNIYHPSFNYPDVEAFIAKAPPYAITLGIPLVPITELTGNTRFWPGTHLTKVRKNDPNLGPGVDFVADLGSCYLFDYRLLHGGVANKSDVPRPLLYSIYTCPWFRDPVNYSKQQPIDITEEQLSKLPIKYQKMFSWVLVDRAVIPKNVNRKGLCYCGSGLLYKSCHGKLER
ncbi:MAG: phytanoyl-CoA dioxygenase family protein [Alphaproteobacteria bacterium]|nr:phytanoyl-CoA dioxygenase family protein [Alphaproteobacteria bacterium]